MPLTVHEARIDQPRTPGFQLEPGRARTGEPVTFGVPLPPGAPCDVDGFGLDGSAVGQFRVLARRDDGACGGPGSVEWLLVDAQVSLGAGGVERGLALVSGSGAFGGSPQPDAPMSSTSPTHYVVDTGAAVFSVRRQGFNFLDDATVGGVDMVSAGGPGILLHADGGATLAASANDAADVVEIEETGPARTVIVARGSLVTYGAQPDALLEYTARLTFWRGSARVKVALTLRNASETRQEHVSFSGLEVIAETTLDEGSFRFATGSGSVSGALAAGETADVFQGENDFPNVRDWDFTDFDGGGNVITAKWPTGIEGYQVRRRSAGGAVTSLASGARTTWIDRLWAMAEDVGPDRGVAVAFRHGAAYWPAGLAVSGGGEVRAGLFPPLNDRPYWVRFTGHVTREAAFDFAAGSPADAEALAASLDQPLVGKPDLDTVRASRAIWEHLLSFAEQRALYTDRGLDLTYPDAWRPAFDPVVPQADPYGFVRHFYWGRGGGLNQYDQAKVAALDFLRLDDQDAGAFWVHAWQKNSYGADHAVYHSDDFDGGRGDIADFNALPGTDSIPIAKVVYEGEHPHAHGLGLWYLLTGEERFREAYEDWGEYLFHPVLEGYDVEARGVLWHLFNLVDLYRFTGEARYRDRAWELFEDEVLQPAEYMAEPGTDWNRGFYAALTDTIDIYNTLQPFEDRWLASFVLGAMAARTYAYLHDFGDGTELQRDRARDVLEGVARFMVTEHWWEYASTVGDYGYPYRQSTDSVPADPRTDPNWIGGFKEAWQAQLHAYLLTGDTEPLRQAEMIQRTLQTPGVTNEFQDWPDRQTLETVLLDPDALPRWIDLPLQVTDLGGGDWRLRWTVPADAVELWVKTSQETIVPWLGFDRTTRQYAFDPSSNDPFFAAENLALEPDPGPEGATQSWDVTGLAPGARDFAARVLVDPAAGAIFADGFESGGLAAWSGGAP